MVRDLFEDPESEIILFRITAHEGEIASGSTASSEPVLNLKSSEDAAATTEGQAEANSLKCDE